MSRTSAFAKDLCTELNRLPLTRQKPRSREWECNGPLPVGRECVDATGYKNGKPRVLVEVELRRTAPLSNVVKIWKWIEADKLPKNIVVIQAFSKFFQQREDDSRLRNAKFIGEMMAQHTGARYIAIDFPFRPGKGAKQGGGARKKQAVRLAAKIAVKIGKLF